MSNTLVLDELGGGLDGAKGRDSLLASLLDGEEQRECVLSLERVGEKEL